MSKQQMTLYNIFLNFHRDDLNEMSSPKITHLLSVNFAYGMLKVKQGRMDGRRSVNKRYFDIQRHAINIGLVLHR